MPDSGYQIPDLETENGGKWRKREEEKNHLFLSLS